MKRVLMLLMPAIMLFAITRVVADDKFDPTARANTIAPYIDEATFLVAHVDVSKIKVDSVMDMFSRNMPNDKEEILQAKMGMQHAMDLFTKTVGNEFYFAIRADIRDPVLFVVPVGEKFDLQSVEQNPMFQPLLREFSFKRAGNVVLGTMANSPALSRLDKITPDKRPELTQAFETAGDSAIQALLLPPKYFRRIIEETMPQLPKEIGGGSTGVVTKGLSWAALGVNFAPQLTARLLVQTPDARSAAELSSFLDNLLKTIAQLPQVKGQTPFSVTDLIPYLTPKVEGDKLVFNFDEKNVDFAILLNKTLNASLSDARDKAMRTQSFSNLKQIGMAMQMYNANYNHFPAAAIYSKDGKPLLSWRVMILPIIGQDNLYKQFHLDEPWDSENNKKLINQMPQLLRSAKSKIKEPGRTNYLVPVGPGTVFEGREGMAAKDIKDGAAQTFMVLEVDDDRAVVWTKPDDLSYNPKEPAKGLGGLNSNVFFALFCDGSVRTIKLPCPDEQLRSAFTAAAGDPSPNF
jgi:hypothetical protein